MRRMSYLIAAGLLLTGVLFSVAPAQLAGAAVHARQAGLPSDRALLSHSVQPGVADVVPGARASAGNDDATLLGNSCATLASCTAVGFYDIPSEDIAPALTENYAGGKWAAYVPIPQYSAYLTEGLSVSCTAPEQCVLVGEHYTTATRPSLLAEVSSTSGWSMLQWNNPRGVRWALFDYVSCVGTMYCMAVGTDHASGSKLSEQDYSARYTGSGGMRAVRTPTPPHARWSDLAGVSCLTAADCVAVGDYENAAKHVQTFAALWNGSKWTLQLKTPNPAKQADTEFNDVDCVSASHCVAVGVTVSRGSHPAYHAFAATWASGRWRQSSMPSVSNAGLDSVSCTSSGCVAVGDRGGSTTLAELWNGHSWRVLRAARLTGKRGSGVLSNVSCPSATHCIAVGYRYIAKRSYSDNTLAEVWNGHSWKVQTTANP